LREVAATEGYAIEPTRSDADSENGKVERPNGTFGAIVPCLLCSASLSARFWSDALVHAIYLKNRLARYLLRSRHKSVTPFVCKLIPLPMNEFTSAPFAIITAATTSDIDRNNSVTVTFSTDPFGPSFPETIFVSVIHPTFGLNLHYDIDHHRCQLITMDPGTPLNIMLQ
jgi:hypothetical protein